jgi:hemerythrin
MAHFEWQQRYETGHGLIDDQHRELIDIANAFFAAVERGEQTKVLREAFDRLLDHADTHFRDEEMFFDEMESPLIDEQRAQHRELAKEIRNIHAMWDEDRYAFADETAKAIEKWLTTRMLPHFLVADLEAAKLARA